MVLESLDGTCQRNENYHGNHATCMSMRYLELDAKNIWQALDGAIPPPFFLRVLATIAIILALFGLNILCVKAFL
jgi:hypothetical protein